MGTPIGMNAIENVVGRLRWRIRAQTALRHGLLLGAVGLFVFAGLVALVKTRVLPTDWVYAGGAVAIALPLVGLAIGALRRLDDQSRSMERYVTGPDLKEIVAGEFRQSSDFGGRSVFGWELPPEPTKRRDN